MPRRSHGQLPYDTGGVVIDDDGTPVGFAPGGRGYIHAEATDQTLQEWRGLGNAVDQDQQTPWLPASDPSLCRAEYGQGTGYQYMDVVAPFRAPDGLWHMVAPIQGCEDRLRGVPTNAAGNRGPASIPLLPRLLRSVPRALF